LVEKDFGKTLEDQTKNEEKQDLSENLDMVNYIMLHRLYDVMTVIASKLVGAEEVEKMIKYHDQGYLLGPAPSYTPQENISES
jgi:hypothetical protein